MEHKALKTKHKTRDIKKAFSSWVIPGVFILLSIYLLINVVSTQLISPLYFKLINGDKNAAGLYLKNILNNQSFSFEIEKFKSVFGNGLESTVYQEKNRREKKIKSLEFILVNNPKERDVLYNLSLLYREAGNNERADYYLARAKEVDPFVK